jgi:hypothetical protein
LCQDGAQESHRVTAGCMVERSFWHPNVFRWCCSLLAHLISHLVTSFYFKKLKHHWKDIILNQQKRCSGLNAGLKLYPTNCSPGMLRQMAACVQTQGMCFEGDHSWWINKIKLFLEPISLLCCPTSYDSVHPINETYFHQQGTR